MEKQVKYDIDGNEILSRAILNLVNEYPMLDKDDRITFSMLPEDKGKALYPTNGAVIQSEKEGITGHVTQNCLYPFNIIFRASPSNEERKIYIKEWLDNLGKWLERQYIRGDGDTYKLFDYPGIGENRKIISIARQTPAFLNNINKNNAEDWYISLVVRYKNEFDR